MKHAVREVCRSRILMLTFGSLLTFTAPPSLAQQAVSLATVAPSTQPIQQRFSFASDGPIGPGWTRPDEIARVYVHQDLPALFQRTLRLDESVPAGGTLSWMFTGPHAGFTVELTQSKVRLFERFYDSTGLYHSGNSPEAIVRDSAQQYTGDVRTLTVIVDAHLSVHVLLNGQRILEQPLTFDITRQQIAFSGPRREHLTLAGALLAEPSADSSITVAPENIHQTMLGFGGSPSIPAYESLSEQGKEQYWQILHRYNLLIDREYPMGEALKPDLSNFDTLEDATPHYYGDNFPNGEVTDFDYMRRTRALGGSVIYEMWALPSWAVQPFTPKGKPIIDAWGKPVRVVAKPDVYARIVIAFCRKAKESTGSAPEIVGIQNEVEEPPAVFNAMAVTLRHALDAAGFTHTKIHMADASFLYLAVQRAKLARQDPDSWHTLDYTTAHQYDFQEFLANPDLYDKRLEAMHAASDGKPFLATEICLNDPHYQESSYRLALQLGQLYQKDLTEADAEALLYCWLLLDVEQPNFGISRALLVPDRSHGQIPVPSSFQLRVLGAFSRHVLRGMRRVETSTENPDLLTSAFTDGTHASLIVLNRSTSAQRLHVNWPGMHWTNIERTSFYTENQESAAPAEIVVNPGELVTLANFSASVTQSNGPGK